MNMDILITITMKDKQRHEVIQQLLNGKLREEEARKQLGLKSVRQIRRIKKRVREEGLEGVVHRGRGRPSNRRRSNEETTKIIKLIGEQYSDFKPTFASEKLLEHHQIRISSESLRHLMTREGLWKVKSRKKPKGRHVWRERKANRGEMQQFDGSYHHWLEDRGGESCLLLSVDDATGEITHAKFDHNEGVVAVFMFWLEYFEQQGLPISIYLDKFSTYKINHPSAVDNKELMTQFQRAMGQVGVNPITAHSPEAKGRVERIFHTLQDRLVKEMRLAGISTVEAANEFLKTYIPKFNKQFAVVSREQADLHRKVSREMKKKLPHIFSIQSKRKVQNDYTVLFETQFFQLEEKQSTTVFKKDTVIVEKHLNGEIKISLKGKHLNYQVLPERPKKQKDIPLAALTTQKAPWTPPADHPWRKPLDLSSRRSRKAGLVAA
jgi:transposase